MLLQDLTSGRAWLVVACVAVFWFASSNFRSWYRLRHIPGPSLASLSYLWIGRVGRSAKQYFVYREFGEKYGPLVRVGPNVLSTDDPDVLKKMNAARTPYTKDYSWYSCGRVNPNVQVMFSSPDPDFHLKMKSKMAAGFSGRETAALEPGVDAEVKKMIALIRKKYLSDDFGSRPLDFANLASFFTLDVITKAGFGEAFGYLAQDRDLFDFLRNARDMWPFFILTVDVPAIRNICYSKTFLKYLGPRLSDKAGVGRMMALAHEIVGARFAGKARERNDILESFMEAGLDQNQCEGECLFMVIAGSDTTASVMRVTMLHLMSNPRVYRKFKEVIAQAVRNGASSPISIEDAKKIPYLQAIIYEGLRMRAPAPGLYSKVVPPEGDTICGYFVPGGTSIGMNASSLLRSKKLFGLDADLFRPERFTEADEVTRTEMERNVELAFGYGRWMCAGKVVAFMELNKIFFELLRAFDLQLVDPAKPWDSRSYAVWVEENMWLRATEATPL